MTAMIYGIRITWIQGKRYIVNVDTDEDNVQRLAHELTHVVTADSSDERTLRSLGAQNFDVAVVAIGGFGSEYADDLTA